MECHTLPQPPPPPPINQLDFLDLESFLEFLYLENVLVKLSGGSWRESCQPPSPTSTSQTVKIIFVDLGISSNFLQLWFRCIFCPPPPPMAKQWEKFFSGFRHFIKFSATLVQVHILTPSPPPPPPPPPTAKQ